jgi:hypothetical protein
MTRLPLFALLASVLLAPSPAIAQDLSGFEKVLLPGWTSSRVVGVGNTTFAGSAVAVAAVPARYWPAADGSIGTLASVSGLIFPGPSRAGRIVHVERAHVDEVSFDVTLYIGKLDQSPFSFTTMPVVREDDAHTDVSRVVNIGSVYDFHNYPDSAYCCIATPRFRHHLRIYDIDNRGDAQVTVRRYDPERSADTPLDETVVTLNVREGTGASYPAYAEMLLPEICHPFSSHTPCAGGSQFVEIEPLTAGLRYFPMVTATDNNTGQVSVKWPQ